MALTPQQLAYKSGVICGICLYNLEEFEGVQLPEDESDESKRLFLLGLAQGIHEAHYGQGETPADLVSEFITSPDIDFCTISSKGSIGALHSKMYNRFSYVNSKTHKDT